MVELARRCERGRRALATGDTATVLWTGLVAEERALRARATRIACAKPGTRDALFRRLLLSADYIQAHYAEPLKVELLAEVSNLSPYHYARLFTLVMDVTPHAFLVRKRVAVARRLLACGVARGEAAEQSGFGSRSTLFRHLRPAAAASR
jgi:AraC-like DNA-binding protein